MLRFFLCLCLVLNSAYCFALESICSPDECYTVIKKLGEGVYGEVYAVENSEGKKLAIKCYKIHEDAVLAKHRYTDVTREFQRGRILNHPNIIKSYDLFSDEVTNYLVLELVDGKTLYKTRRGDIPRIQSLEAAIHFCEAIDYALSLGFFHLDLHEANAMFSNESDIKIIDLASFFTLDELFHFIVSTTEETEEVVSEANSSRQEKMQAFFMKNPQLFKKMKGKAVELKCRASTKESTPLLDLDDELHIQNIMSAHYFGMFSEFLQKIIEKADFTRDERLSLCLEIKKLAWNYSEDVKTFNEAPFEAYFSDLMSCLDTLE